MFNPKIGINNLLAQFGIKGPLWLMDSKGFIVLPMWVIAFVALWQYVGQNMMLYMAQITGISRDIYEASYIDGASKTQSFRYITLPLLKPMTLFVIITSIISYLQAYVQILIMTEGGPGTATYLASYIIYDEAFVKYNFGYASALSFVLFVITAVFTWLSFRVSGTED